VRLLRRAVSGLGATTRHVWWRDPWRLLDYSRRTVGGASESSMSAHPPVLMSVCEFSDELLPSSADARGAGRSGAGQLRFRGADPSALSVASDKMNRMDDEPSGASGPTSPG